MTTIVVFFLCGSHFGFMQIGTLPHINKYIFIRLLIC